jgi:hypothetical protein
MNEALLDFVRLTGSHTGESMAEHVVAILTDYKLQDKLFCITTDGARNNDTMAKSLERRLAELNIVWDPETQHINCLDHVINLAVQAFLRELKVVQPETEGEEEEDLDPDSDLKEPPGTFSAVMEKIRAIAKVPPRVTPKPYPEFPSECTLCVTSRDHI